MKLRLTVNMEPLRPEDVLGESGWYWAYCPELDLGTQLRAGEDWFARLDEMLAMHLQTLADLGQLDAELARLTEGAQSSAPPELVADYELRHRRPIEL